MSKTLFFGLFLSLFSVNLPIYASSLSVDQIIAFNQRIQSVAPNRSSIYTDSCAPGENGLYNSAPRSYQNPNVPNQTLLTIDTLKTNQDISWGFRIENRMSPRVNPVGCARGAIEGLKCVTREYHFLYNCRARQNISLMILDRGTDKTDSSGSMFSELMFFPRVALPSARIVKYKNQDVIDVTLPTGESVWFDASTKEIVAGVLQEVETIDLNPNRHARKFSQLSYSGNGIVLRVNQRGELTRSQTVFGSAQGSKVKAVYGNRVCEFNRSEVFGQDFMYEFKFATDEEFYQFLSRKCGWPLQEMPR